MIDEYSQDRTGWARFSDDKSKRYRLGRALSPRALDPSHLRIPDDLLAQISIVVFILLNPSTATATKPDPTAKKTFKFGATWGYDFGEIVNLFPDRTPYPEDLRRLTRPIVDEENDAQILAACARAQMVVGAWGVHGDLDNRAEHVRSLIAKAGIALHRLEGPLTDNGQPKHPLARGKHHVPSTAKPVLWKDAT